MIDFLTGIPGALKRAAGRLSRLFSGVQRSFRAVGRRVRSHPVGRSCADVAVLAALFVVLFFVWPALCPRRVAEAALACWWAVLLTLIF